MPQSIAKCTQRKADGTPCRAWAVRGTDPPACRNHAPQEELRDIEQSTSPWNASENPWSVDMLRLKKLHPGWRAKWVNRDNIQKYYDLGYQVANIKDYGGKYSTLPGEEGDIDTTVRRRELILVEITEEMAQKRDEYIAWKSNRAMEAAHNIAHRESAELKRAGQDPHMETKYSDKPGGF